MNRRRVTRGAVLFATLLLLSALPVSADQGAVQYRGGAIEMTAEGACYIASKPTGVQDLISGCWTMTFEEWIDLPKGGARFAGTAASADLTAFEGADTGGWVGAFHGVMLPNGDMIVNGKNEGWGALEGWGMKHHEAWRGGDPAFWGHFLPAE